MRGSASAALALALALGPLASGGAAHAGDLQLNYGIGSLASPLLGASGSALPVGSAVFLYRSPGPVVASAIVQKQGAGGFAWVTPGNVIAVLSVGQGVQPASFSPQGRVVGTLGLGNSSDPNSQPASVGDKIVVVAFDAPNIASATKVAVSANGFTVPTLPASGDVPAFVDFEFAALSLVDADNDGFANVSDSCPHASNPLQEDAGGIGYGSAADGIGNACQCGDVDGNGVVTAADALIIRRALLVPPTATMSKPELCDVGGSAGCSGGDALVIRRALLVPPTAPISQSCPPANP